MTFLPGFFPASIMTSAAAVVTPKAYIFNGTNEYLKRTLSTSSPSTTKFTYSVWMKIDAWTNSTPDPTASGAPIFQVVNQPVVSRFIAWDLTLSGDQIGAAQSDGTAEWMEVAKSLTPDVALGSWVHFVLRYDSTDATADDRLRHYRNGVLLTDTDVDTGKPALNETHCLFTNGREHQIGAEADINFWLDGKLAFIDVLDGVSVDANSFGFDDGGVWTRKPYTGSYGTHGFRLDGINGFNDSSGNGQHFTGTNMTEVDNISDADLPPYTS
jgi:hypothetical protein